jgi:uracil-DNA glycosylase
MSSKKAKRNSSSDSGGTPTTKKKPTAESLSPEQHSKMEHNKQEAAAKLWASRLKAGTIGCSWMKILYDEFKKPYFEELVAFVDKERSKETVYPPATDVFTWTTACTLEEVKVVIIGQDPYHGPNQAHGLCFSVKPGVPPPPSLQNMYKELLTDVKGFKIPDHGCLIGWARQGVLLLNACLTVRARQANSHQGKGWEKVTDAVIKWLNDNTSDLVFILWGAYAQKKGSVIDKKRHNVLKGVHPSPLSAHRGFFGCKHFSQANQILEKNGKNAIDWSHLPKDL